MTPFDKNISKLNASTKYKLLLSHIYMTGLRNKLKALIKSSLQGFGIMGFVDTFLCMVKSKEIAATYAVLIFGQQNIISNNFVEIIKYGAIFKSVSIFNGSDSSMLTLNFKTNNGISVIRKMNSVIIRVIRLQDLFSFIVKYNLDGLVTFGSTLFRFFEIWQNITMFTNITRGLFTPMLNDEQQAAIQEVTGYHAINSGAGTGKTMVLVERLARIHQLYPTATGLMLAFTKSAALELSQRVGSMDGVRISTLHSLSYHIIKSSGWKFTVEPSAENQESLIKGLIGDRSIVTVPEVVQSLHMVSGISTAVTRIRNKFLKWLREQQVVTFDTMPLFALTLLRKHTGLRSSWQNRYDFVQLDEAQDLDAIQAELIQLLTVTTKNLCCCGDSRQEIYGFRGSYGFMKEFSESAINHSLSCNYRCNPAILILANQIMSEYKPLVSVSKVSPHQPQFITAKDDNDEAKFVVDEITRLNKQGQEYKDTAILYRSSAVAEAVIQELLSRQIPFQTKSALPVKYNRKPYREIIRLLKYVSDPKIENLREILSIFYIKKSRIAEVENTVSEQQYTLMKALPMLTAKSYHRAYVEELSDAVDAVIGMSPARAIRQLMKHGLDRYFGESMTLAVETVIADLLKYATVEEFLQQVETTQTQLKKIRENAVKNNDAVQLMTIHTAKGTEFKNVFVIGAHEGSLPSSRPDADIAEEKRLMYVTVTRAEERLYISYPKYNAETIEENKPSRFLAGLF